MEMASSTCLITIQREQLLLSSCCLSFVVIFVSLCTLLVCFTFLLIAMTEASSIRVIRMETTTQWEKERVLDIISMSLGTKYGRWICSLKLPD